MHDWTKFEAYKRGATWMAVCHYLKFRTVEPPTSAELAREIFLYTQRQAAKEG